MIYELCTELWRHHIHSVGLKNADPHGFVDFHNEKDAVTVLKWLFMKLTVWPPNCFPSSPYIGVDILCKKGLVCISWQNMLEFWIFKPRFKIYRVRWLKWYQTTLYLVKLDFWCLWKLMIFWIKNIYANSENFSSKFNLGYHIPKFVKFNGDYC